MIDVEAVSYTHDHSSELSSVLGPVGRRISARLIQRRTNVANVKPMNVILSPLAKPRSAAFRRPIGVRNEVLARLADARNGTTATRRRINCGHSQSVRCCS